MAVPTIERKIRETFATYRRANPLAGVDAVIHLLGEHKDWVAEFEAQGDRVAVVALAEEAGQRRFHRFTLEFAAPDPAGPGTAAREVAGRREQEDLLVRGLADALELGHTIKKARERLRERAGPDNVLYDAIELGTRTFRELIELHTRANRSLLGALRRLTPNSKAPPTSEEVRLTMKQGAPEVRGELVLMNRRHREIHVEMPAGVYVCGPENALTTHWIDLQSAPPSLTLLRNDRRTVVLTIKSNVVRALAEGTYHGELVLGTGDGDFAPVRITLVRPALVRPA